MASQPLEVRFTRLDRDQHVHADGARPMKMEYGVRSAEYRCADEARLRWDENKMFMLPLVSPCNVVGVHAKPVKRENR